MHFLIIGAGGIGCYYGARLETVGHNVTYLARGDHLRALQTEGLKVSHPDFEYHQPAQAVDSDQLQKRFECANFDLIMLATKAGATEQIMQELKGWLIDAGTPVLSLQNGVDNEPVIAKTIGEKRTLGGLAVRIGGHIVSPGVIEATGPAQIIMGYWPNQSQNTQNLKITPEQFADVFNAANIPTQVSSDIQYELWRKLIINNGVNPLSALTELDTQTLTRHPVLTKTVYAMMEEVALVATADKVKLTKQDVDEMYNLICTFDAIKTSMLVDKEKGRPLELSPICGAVLRRAEALGVETPNTALINALLMLQA